MDGISCVGPVLVCVTELGEVGGKGIAVKEDHVVLINLPNGVVETVIKAD